MVAPKTAMGTSFLTLLDGKNCALLMICENQKGLRLWFLLIEFKLRLTFDGCRDKILPKFYGDPRKIFAERLPQSSHLIFPSKIFSEKKISNAVVSVFSFSWNCPWGAYLILQSRNVSAFNIKNVWASPRLGSQKWRIKIPLSAIFFNLFLETR